MDLLYLSDIVVTSRVNQFFDRIAEKSIDLRKQIINRDFASSKKALFRWESTLPFLLRE